MNYLIIVVLYLFLFLHTVHCNCVMYGQCHYDEEKGVNLNCYYEGDGKEPEVLNKTREGYEIAIKELQNYCSYFFYDDEGNKKGE